VYPCQVFWFVTRFQNQSLPRAVCGSIKEFSLYAIGYY
jgi:hypothetical protein